MIALEARRAIESLRAGVPSAAAVRAIGSGQPELERRFREMLSRAGRDGGLLVRANYGEGKSHFLTCLEREALDHGFAASRVVVSKQVPLSDPAKLLPAITESLRVGADVGRGLDQLHERLLRAVDSGVFDSFAQELEHVETVDTRFPATVTLFRQARDEELRDRILRFWAGDKLGVSEIRGPLRGLGLAAGYPLASIKARELALQKVAFLPRLLRAVGLQGMVLLIDEVELIGQYSRLARARAYAELHRFLSGSTGVITVAAISSDFSQAVLDDKGDRDGLVSFLQLRYPELINPAEAGMELIDGALLFVPPDQEQKERAHAELRRLYREAYDWPPPEVKWPDAVGETPMRTYVRAWITAWDLRRLRPDTRPDEAGFEISRPSGDYGEEPELDPDEPASGSER